MNPTQWFAIIYDIPISFLAVNAGEFHPQKTTVHNHRSEIYGGKERKAGDNSM